MQNNCFTPKCLSCYHWKRYRLIEILFCRFWNTCQGAFQKYKKINYVKYRNSIKLSKYIWQLKNLKVTPTISWKIAAAIRCAARIDCCKLCLTEKLFIIKSFDNNQLSNKKSELFSTCRHKKKLSLKTLKRNRSRNDTMGWVSSGKMILIYWLNYIF